MRRRIILDLDCTLINSPTHEIWTRVLGIHGFTKEEALQAFLVGTGPKHGHPVHIAAQAAFPDASKREISEILATYEELLLAAPAPAMPEAEDTLERLLSAGHTLYLSSGSSDNVVEAALIKRGWQNVFTLSLGSSAVPKGHGHLELFARHTGIQLSDFARDTLTVGDDVREMRIGLAGGLPWRCAVLWPHLNQNEKALAVAGANLRIEGLKALPELAASRNPLLRWPLIFQVS